MTVIIVDYGAGNIQSVHHACTHLGVNCKVSNNIHDLKTASHVIVPGQGAFKQAITLFKKTGLDEAIMSCIKSGTLFLGICLGFQVLFESSDEHGHHQGLGVVNGRVEKIISQSLKVPHIGWNTVTTQHSSMFNNIAQDSFFYFVHSYYVTQTENNCIAATTDYEKNFVSAIAKDNVWGTQFHPEKSSGVGLQLLQNFLKL